MTIHHLVIQSTSLSPLTEADVFPFQRVAAVYVLCGYNQVVMGSSRINVTETHQLIILWAEHTHTHLPT